MKKKTSDWQKGSLLAYFQAKDPSLLRKSDSQAFHVCREFLEALRTGTHKKIENSNQDLRDYFTHIQREWREDEHYTF